MGPSSLDSCHISLNQVRLALRCCRASFVPRSSKGRTKDFESFNPGSNPGLGANLLTGAHGDAVPMRSDVEVVAGRLCRSGGLMREILADCGGYYRTAAADCTIAPSSS